jgi:hypothetical protein
VLTAIALTPTAPVLVSDLAGAAAAEVAEVREAAVAAAATLPQRWIAVGVGPVGERIGPETRGTFAGYGVDVPVALSPEAGSRITAMPLCALFGAWLRGQANPRAIVEVRVCAADLDAAAAVDLGRSLRAEIDDIAEPIGVLVLADGATTLTPSAPGSYDAGSEAGQSVLDDALAAGDVAALVRLPDWIAGRVAYQVLVGLAEPGPWDATELARSAPYGVGYFVGTWVPGQSGGPATP